MARVNRIVEVDTSEDGEDVGLQECDQRFQRKENDDHCEWEHSADPAEDPEPGAEQDDEAGEYLKRNVSGQHVGEETHAVRDRSRYERKDLDRHNQRQDVNGHALGHEQIEEMQPVPNETVYQD